MNYLAHLRLGRRDRFSLIGNLMGDFRRHVNGLMLPHAVIRGIDNHLRVDRFTDNHVRVRTLKTCFSRERRRYAGIILDVAFDHFLALHWQRYCPEPREIFIDHCYASLACGMDLMPARMQYVVKRMIREDWLGSYQDLSGVDMALDGIARRIRFKNNLWGAAQEVADNYNKISKVFHGFFPDLLHHIEAADHGVVGMNGTIL